MGAGELLDRAVTLYVRRFASIVAILAVVNVPLLALQARISPHAGSAWSDLARVIAAGPRHAGSAAATMSHAGSDGRQTAATVAAGALLRLLTWTALLVLIAGADAGTTTRVAAAFRIGLRRWPAQLLVAVVFLILGCIIATPLLVAYVIVLAVIVALGAGLHAVLAAGLLAALAGLAIGALAIVAFAWGYMAYNLAAAAVAIDGAPPLTAVGDGLRAALAPGMRARTLAGGLVLAAISFVGTLPLVAAGAAVAALTHAGALYFAIVGGGTIAIEGLLAAFVAVFATDVRVRREGLDIALAAEQTPLPA